MKAEIKKEFERLERKLDDRLRAKVDIETGRMCAGGCGRPARKSSNFCGYYFARKGWGCEPPVGTAGKCTCNIKSKELAGICNYCYLRSKIARECTCPRLTGIDGNCPIHGREACMKQPTPDLPLNAKVAEALGSKIKYHPMLGVVIDRGFGVTPDDIPPYDTDLEAAMGALEEYCRKWDLSFRITWSTQGIWIIIRHVTWGASIVKTLGKYDDIDGLIAEDLYACDLPQAICEAICKHAEAQ